MDNKNCLEPHHICLKSSFYKFFFQTQPFHPPFLAHFSSPNFHRSLSTKDIASFCKEKIELLHRNPPAPSPCTFTNKEEPQLLTEINFFSCTLTLQPFQGWLFCHYSSLPSSMNVSLSTGSCPPILNHAPKLSFKENGIYKFICTENRWVVARGKGWAVSQMGKSGQKVQTSSYKINKSWRHNV